MANAKRIGGTRSPPGIVARHQNRGQLDDGIHRRRFDSDLASQAGHENQAVADILMDVAMIELRLGADPLEARRFSIGCAVVVGKHVPLADTHRGIAQDFDIQSGADGNAFPIHSLDQPADRICHALFVEEESTTRAFDTGGIGQRYGRMNNRVSVLQAGLEDALGPLHGRIDVREEVQDLVGVSAGKGCQEIAGFELQKEADLARLDQPNRIMKRVGLRDRYRLILEIETRRHLESQRASARARRDNNRHPRLEFSGHCLAEWNGAESRPDYIDEFGVSKRFIDIVASVSHRRKPRELPLRMDSTLTGDLRNIVGN